MDLPIHPDLGASFDYSEALRDLSNALEGLHDAPAASEISQQVVQLGALLLKKNAAYGDAALSPIEVFARDMKTSERLGVRMDDKISRLANGKADGEDPQMDLAGYLVLLRIALAREATDAAPAKAKPSPYAIEPTPVPDVTPLEAAVPTNA